jgi:hypothetical protein
MIAHRHWSDSIPKRFCAKSSAAHRDETPVSSKRRVVSSRMGLRMTEGPQLQGFHTCDGARNPSPPSQGSRH